MLTFALDYATAFAALWPVILAAVGIFGTASLAFNGGIAWLVIADQIHLRRRARKIGRTVDELMDADEWAKRNGYGPAVLDEPRPVMPPSLAAYIAEQFAADVDAEWLAICRATGGDAA